VGVKKVVMMRQTMSLRNSLLHRPNFHPSENRLMAPPPAKGRSRRKKEAPWKQQPVRSLNLLSPVLMWTFLHLLQGRGI
jgi:hypothetical protein